jgi:hypothetical protein
MPSERDVRALAKAHGALVAAREECVTRRQNAFDDPERLLQNSASCRALLHDAMLDALGPFVNIHYDRFREGTGMALEATAMRPKPLVPSRNTSKILGWDHLSAREGSVLRLICTWRLAQIWHGANTTGALHAHAAVHNTLEGFAYTDPGLFDSLAVVLCYNMCVRPNNQAGGNVPLIAPGTSRRYLNQKSAFLTDAFSIYLLTTISATPIVYAMADRLARLNVHLAVSLVMLAGDDALQYVAPDLYQGADRNWVFVLLVKARKFFYLHSQNPKHRPFLTQWDGGDAPQVGPLGRDQQRSPPAFHGLTSKPHEHRVLADPWSWSQGYTPPPHWGP